jgi:hypothetical protein
VWTQGAAEERRNCVLLLLDDPAEIYIGQVKQALQLGDPLFTDLAGVMPRLGLVQEALCLLLIGPRHVKGMFQGCLVLKSRVVFHDTSLVPFPG